MSQGATALRESLSLMRDLGITFGVTTALDQYAALLTARGDVSTAARLWGAGGSAGARHVTQLSCNGVESASARKPVDVWEPSAVSMLSLSRIGMPCSGPRGPLTRHSASSSRATLKASGMTSMTEPRRGPPWSRDWIRSG